MAPGTSLEAIVVGSQGGNLKQPVTVTAQSRRRAWSNDDSVLGSTDRVGFPAHSWQLTTVWSSSPMKSSTLFWSPGGLYSRGTHTCKAKTQTHKIIKRTTEKAKKESGSLAPS